MCSSISVNHYSHTLYIHLNCPFPYSYDLPLFLTLTNCSIKVQHIITSKINAMKYKEHSTSRNMIEVKESDTRKTGSSIITAENIAVAKGRTDNPKITHLYETVAWLSLDNPIPEANFHTGA